MQLKDRTGIACDHCGTQYKDDFTYYSFDFRQLESNNNIRPQLNRIFGTHIIFSLDICTACYHSLTNKVIANYKDTMDKNMNGIICELSGEKLSGTFGYYHVEVVKVAVRMTGQPNICTNCQNKTFDDKICQNCNGTEFVRPASTHLDKRHLEFNICDDVYSSLRTKAEQVRKVAGQWTTTS